MKLSELIILIFAIGVSLGVVVLGLRFIYEYRIRDNGIEFVIFGTISVYRVSVNNIESAEKISRRQLGIGGFTLRLGNRFMSTCVLIRKRRGPIRKIVITPADPDKFVGRVTALIQQEPR
jgi:hypothetical protein